MTQQAYSVLAAYYDAFMEHVDYDAWVDYALKRLGLPPKAPSREITLLDLGCGTGSITIKLAERGYRMIGVDGSVEMLAMAEQKAREAGVEIVFTHQDVTEFSVPWPVDGIVCLCDTLNYVTRDEQLAVSFQRAADALNPGRALLFDLHTEFRFKEMAQSVYVEEMDEAMYVWTSEYDETTRLCTMELSLFVSQGESLYRRYDESHVERAYMHVEVQAALQSAGMLLEGVYGELSDEPPRFDEGRIFYLARKPA